MKKLNKILAIAIAFFIANTSFATKVHSAANGNMSNSGSWVSNPPTNYDTVYIDHAITFNGTQDWSSSTVNIVIISSSGSLSPASTNASFRIPSGATIYIAASSGYIINASGNNSNHEIRIGSTCVWGKKCCAGNDSIQGPALLDASNPCGYTPLPVHLVSFAATMTTVNTVSINWSTASEEQNKKFIIESSIDGKSFVAIGEVASAANDGNSQNLLNYQFIDARDLPKTSSVFYRIKQIDLNNETGFISNIVSVKNSEATIGSKPVKISQYSSNGINAVCINPADADLGYIISVYTMLGEKVFSQDQPVYGLQNVVLSNFSFGIFIVQIQFVDNGEIINQKILVR